ncbi:MAG TPA: cytochrome c3 family protein [Holophagaceae bacterium]
MTRNPYRNLRVVPWYKSIRWRGRRWYDPNERKVIWSSLGMAAAMGMVRLLLYAATAGHAAPLAASSLPPSTGILGSPHDLSARGPSHATQSMEACVFCHSPHGGQEDQAQDIPVWNHVTTTAHFTMYASASLKGAVDAQPTGSSLACLSCHDGTVAVGAVYALPTGGGQDDYSQAQGDVNAQTGHLQGASRLGSDLSTGHPVSITYRDDLDSHLRPPADLVGVKLYPSNARGAKVQCGSCHDPHNFGTQGGTAPFLRVTKAGSALCLRCHLI